MFDPRWFVPRLLRDGRVAVWRPVCAGDAGALEALFMRQSALARRCRFHGVVNGFTQGQLAQMTAGARDAAPGLALVLATLDPARPPAQTLLAEARFAGTGGGSAEVALLVDEPWRRQGLAGEALDLLCSAARHLGLHSLHGRVLEINDAMLALAQRAGWPAARDRDDARVRCFRIDLGRGVHAPSRAPSPAPPALSAPASAPAAAAPATSRAAPCVR